MQVRIPARPDIWAELKVIAIRENRTLANYLNEIIEDVVAKKRSEPK